MPGARHHCTGPSQVNFHALRLLTEAWGGLALQHDHITEAAVEFSALVIPPATRAAGGAGAGAGAEGGGGGLAARHPQLAAAFREGVGPGFGPGDLAILAGALAAAGSEDSAVSRTRGALGCCFSSSSKQRKKGGGGGQSMKRPKEVAASD